METEEYFNKDKLKDNFWYEKSYYKKYYEENYKIGPNIAVYCLTPSLPYDELNESETFDSEKVKNIRVLNVIGYAFDDEKQPDFQYFKDKTESLEKHMVLIFEKILACIHHFKDSDNNIQWMHLPGFGTGYFSRLLPISITVFKSVLKQYKLQFEKLGVTVDTSNIYTHGDFSNNSLRMYDTWAEHDEEAIPLKHRLYINGWDPHSIIGNGNFIDPSLDGYYGRSTALSLLGWSITNPFITYVVTR